MQKKLLILSLFGSTTIFSMDYNILYNDTKSVYGNTNNSNNNNYVNNTEHQYAFYDEQGNVIAYDDGSTYGVFKAIEEHNRQIEEQNRKKQCEFAARHMRTEDVSVLTQHFSIEEFHNAARAGDILVLKGQLSQGVPVDLPVEGAGYTALHFASRYGHEDVVNLLLDNKANVRQKSKTGLTALHFAAKNYKDNVIKILLERGAVVDDADNMDYSALHHAAINCDKVSIDLLLKAGALFYASKVNNKTPLDLVNDTNDTIMHNRELLNKNFDVNKSLSLLGKAPAQIPNKLLSNNNVMQRKELRESKKFECSICLDDILEAEVQWTSCEHSFHKPCIKNWLSTKSTCPICQTPQEQN